MRSFLSAGWSGSTRGTSSSRSASLLSPECSSPGRSRPIDGESGNAETCPVSPVRPDPAVGVRAMTRSPSDTPSRPVHQRLALPGVAWLLAWPVMRSLSACCRCSSRPCPPVPGCCVDRHRCSVRADGVGRRAEPDHRGRRCAVCRVRGAAPVPPPRHPGRGPGVRGRQPLPLAASRGLVGFRFACGFTSWHGLWPSSAPGRPVPWPGRRPGPRLGQAGLRSGAGLVRRGPVFGSASARFIPRRLGSGLSGVGWRRVAVWCGVVRVGPAGVRGLGGDAWVVPVYCSGAACTAMAAHRAGSRSGSP